MSKAFAWIMTVLAIVMLLLQFGAATTVNVWVVLLWVLVLALCIYVLFFRKPRPNAPR